MCNEEIKTEKSIKNIATALSKAQVVMRGAKKDSKNLFFKSSYSSLASVFEAIREPFTSNGLAVSQLMDVRDDGRTVIITKLMHVSGESIESKMLLPEIIDPQKLGSAISYYRRYSLMAIAAIPSEDDDGNEAAKAPKPSYISSRQVAHLEELINGNVEIRKKVLANCGNNLSSITVDRYPGAIKWIESLLIEYAPKETMDFIDQFNLADSESDASKFIDKISESLDQPRKKIIEDCSKDPDKFQKNLDKYVEKMNIKKSEEN